MPKPNPLNPTCPVCGKPTTFNGVCPSGAKQYRCRRHSPNYTTTDSDRPAYRLGEKLGTALTQLEREARWKERDPEGYAAAQKRKRENKKRKKAAKS